MTRLDAVGLIPAAGWGSRLADTPVSKELLPAWRAAGGSSDAGEALDAVDAMPLPACRCCLDAMRVGGVGSVLVPIRTEKWDLARYLEREEGLGVRVALVPTGETRGPVESVARGLAFAGRSVVAFGFPDIVFQASDPFGRLLERLDREGVDGVLGLFPHPPGRAADSVSLSPDGRVTGIVGGARSENGGWSWALAVWKESVSAHLRRYGSGLSATPEGEGPVDDPRLTLGAAFQAGMDEGLRLDGLPLSDTSFVDIGEPRGWAEAIRASFGDRRGAE